LQAGDNIKEKVWIDFLWKISNILGKNSEPSELVNAISENFSTIINLKELEIFIHDCNTDTIKNFAKNWITVDSDDKTGNIFCDTNYDKKTNYLIFNDQTINFEETKNLSLKNLLSKELNTIIIPLSYGKETIGYIEIIFDSLKHEPDPEVFFMLLYISASQIASKISNLRLNELMEMSINFHQAMKDIAKIIEFQYELAYIVPLIGEMIDKFIPEHLIYIFDKPDKEGFRLLWPKAYTKNRLDPYLEQIQTDHDSIISEDQTIGVFPLIADNSLIGAIAADGKISKLTQKETDYLEQLSKQASITIDKANTYAEILKHATLDALTGLNNRRQLESRIKQEVASAKRHKSELCCMMLDIDNFKSINDTYGHMVGDMVLQEFSKIVTQQIRECDFAARYGGEEFCVLLPSTNIKDAEFVANRLRQKVEETKFDILDHNKKDIKHISITASIGLAKFNPETEGHSGLYEDADKSLYKAKKDGRNRVIVCE